MKMYDTIDVSHLFEISDATEGLNLDPFDSISKLQLFIER
jgi:hypothetical protein